VYPYIIHRQFLLAFFWDLKNERVPGISCWRWVWEEQKYLGASSTSSMLG
jgi:hypothetical protein